MERIEIKFPYLCKILEVFSLPLYSKEIFLVQKGVENEAIRCEAERNFRITGPLKTMQYFGTGIQYKNNQC